MEEDNRLGRALLGSEEYAAQRIAAEREKREWSTATLAKQVTEAGCPMNQSAVWRIENGDPPRRINLDEAVAFAQVFGISLDDLISPPQIVITPELRSHFRNLLDAMRASKETSDAVYRVAEDLDGYARAHPKELAAIRDISILLSDDPNTTFGLSTLGRPFLEALGIYDYYLEQRERESRKVSEHVEKSLELDELRERLNEEFPH
ncbi:helix-turn-helix transcriptional regulator [Streptacidiphilus sp. P02-A3a]|uniref:helix-turn-helix transcriptional regulator n=1 Tax=Streptacidiphilus sp. P02-A3a TaxID=2704468 RepID=UPI0015FD48F4|nr:helix-turn-helix transcriptional regulator [Streptacidiphilus sp. P02-A3a]QMU67102.1 helix-turn-helix transcriptional regulator [Streptacidiphilus sp. P02-A3a]